MKQTEKNKRRIKAKKINKINETRGWRREVKENDVDEWIQENGVVAMTHSSAISPLQSNILRRNHFFLFLIVFLQAAPTSKYFVDYEWKLFVKWGKVWLSQCLRVVHQSVIVWRIEIRIINAKCFLCLLQFSCGNVNRILLFSIAERNKQNRMHVEINQAFLSNEW